MSKRKVTPPMTWGWCEYGRIATGSMPRTAADAAQLVDAGITHVLNVADDREGDREGRLLWVATEGPDYLTPITYTRVPFRDTGVPMPDWWFHRGVEWLQRALEDPRSVVYRPLPCRERPWAQHDVRPAARPRVQPLHRRPGGEGGAPDGLPVLPRRRRLVGRPRHASLMLVHDDGRVAIHQGDCREVMRGLPEESVDCIVTSPPYWGLRDYGLPPSVWGGVEEHEHRWGVPEGYGGHRGKRGQVAQTKMPGRDYPQSGQGSTSAWCECGAWLGCLGLENTPDLYVQHLVDVMREAARVLTPEGTLWLNLGDSYANDGKWGGRTGGKHAIGLHDAPVGRARRSSGLKPKDLVGIPWRAAFALQDDGWFLRSDIIWSKPNAMPESVEDRPTRAHEYFFLLTREPTYWYDHSAIREPAVTGAWDAMPPIGGVKKAGGDNATYSGNTPASAGLRNRRDVWTIPTRPYPGAHYAVFPPELIRPAILAGVPPAGKRCDCAHVIETPQGDETPDPTMQTGRAGMNRPRSGAATRPITRREQRSYAVQMRRSRHHMEMQDEAGPAFAHYVRTDDSGARPLPPDLLEKWLAAGWLTTPEPCLHPDAPPGVVLDPFGGSGTVGLVAQQEGRRAILIDLNGDYLRQQMARTTREFGVGGTYAREGAEGKPAPEDSLWTT